MQILIGIVEVALAALAAGIFVFAVGSAIYCFRTAKKHAVPASWYYAAGVFQILIALAIQADVILGCIFH